MELKNKSYLILETNNIFKFLQFSSSFIYNNTHIKKQNQTCVLVHRKTAVTNPNSFRTLKHVFRKSEYYSTELFCIRGNWLSFQNPQNLLKKETQFASRERQPQSHKVNIFTEITLWVRFTLLTRSAHGPGEDPFEAVMCTSGGCLSNLMNAYRRYLFLIQNITWISAGLYHTKRLSKRYTVARFIIRFQQKRIILLHGKKMFTRKSYCGHKLINFS